MGRVKSKLTVSGCIFIKVKLESYVEISDVNSQLSLFLNFTEFYALKRNSRKMWDHCFKLTYIANIHHDLSSLVTPIAKIRKVLAVTSATRVTYLFRTI